MITNLLDTIKTKQKERYGVVDYTTKKYVIFYDLTHFHEPSIRMLILLWRINSDNMRFSVYCKTFFPDIEIPEPVVIPHLGIENKDDITTVYSAPKSKIKKAT